MEDKEVIERLEDLIKEAVKRVIERLAVDERGSRFFDEWWRGGECIGLSGDSQRATPEGAEED